MKHEVQPVIVRFFAENLYFITLIGLGSADLIVDNGGAAAHAKPVIFTSN